MVPKKNSRMKFYRKICTYLFTHLQPNGIINLNTKLVDSLFYVRLLLPPQVIRVTDSSKMHQARTESKIPVAEMNFSVLRVEKSMRGLPTTVQC